MVVKSIRAGQSYAFAFPGSVFLGSLLFALASIAIPAFAGSKPAAKTAPPPKPAPTARPSASTPGARPGVPGARPGAPAPTVRPRLNPSSSELKTPGVHPTHEGVVKTDARGYQRRYDQAGHMRSMEAPGMRARFNAHGRPESFHVEHGLVSHSLQHGPGGVRVVEGARPAMGGGTVRVVGYGARRGFVERPIYGRYGYMRRSYMVGGHPYAVVYRGYRYRGLYFYRPVPAVVYAPGYYAWAASPWSGPASIQVGFTSQAWYPVYGQTFTPYSTYASPDQWMTDQMLASNMQQAYDASHDAQAADARLAATLPGFDRDELAIIHKIWFQASTTAPV